MESPPYKTAPASLKGRRRQTGGPISEFMAAEHAFLDELLAQASRGSIPAYRQFRERLLRHISIEEKLLLPMAQRRRSGEPLPMAARLRLDHGALAALMLLPPAPGTFKAVGAVLAAHNPLEEDPGGVYEQCDALAGGESGELLRRAAEMPAVPVSAWVENHARVLAAVRRALVRGGYSAALID